jgi:hypothetical protein
MRLRNLGGVGVLALSLSACGGTTPTAPPSIGADGTPSDGDLNVSAAVEDLTRHEKDLTRVGRKRVAAVTTEGQQSPVAAEHDPSSNSAVGTLGDSDSNASAAVKDLPEDAENVPLARVKRVEVVTTQGHRFQVAAEHDPWADEMVSYKPGRPAPRGNKDPREAIGKPDGKNVALGHGGELVLEFRDNVLVDGPQDDLVVFEVGGAVEPTAIAISEDGKLWIDVGRTKGGKSSVDVGPFVKPGQLFRFVKVTDAKAGGSNGSQWPGADIEAVGALNSLPGQ